MQNRVGSGGRLGSGSGRDYNSMLNSGATNDPSKGLPTEETPLIGEGISVNESAVEGDPFYSQVPRLLNDLNAFKGLFSEQQTGFRWSKFISNALLYRTNEQCVLGAVTKLENVLNSLPREDDSHSEQALSTKERFKKFNSVINALDHLNSASNNYTLNKIKLPIVIQLMFVLGLLMIFAALMTFFFTPHISFMKIILPIIGGGCILLSLSIAHVIPGTVDKINFNSSDKDAEAKRRCIGQLCHKYIYAEESFYEEAKERRDSEKREKVERRAIVSTLECID